MKFILSARNRWEDSPNKQAKPIDQAILDAWRNDDWVTDLPSKPDKLVIRYESPDYRPGWVKRGNKK
jgi:hypothetical protein